VRTWAHIAPLIAPGSALAACGGSQPPAAALKNVKGVLRPNRHTAMSWRHIRGQHNIHLDGQIWPAFQSFFTSRP
jgi:hypothetical protein